MPGKTMLSGKGSSHEAVQLVSLNTAQDAPESGPKLDMLPTNPDGALMQALRECVANAQVPAQFCPVQRKTPPGVRFSRESPKTPDSARFRLRYSVIRVSRASACLRFALTETRTMVTMKRERRKDNIVSEEDTKIAALWMFYAACFDCIQ